MGAIKAVVIGMGVLILAGFVVVAATLISRMQDGDDPRQPFQNLVTLPPDARVVETLLGDGRIVLRVEAGDGSQSLLILNVADGQERGRINLAIAPQ
jgi:hypothetical protein